MNNVAAAPAWKSYYVGATVATPDGIEWKIIECQKRPTAKGYQSRVFTLLGPDGRKVRKTARGITLFSTEVEVSEAKPQVVEFAPTKPVAPAPVVEPVPGQVRHANYGALLRAVAAKCNVWLVGPAGSGKTSAAENVAKDLGLPFYSKSVGPQTSESSLLGYQDANGRTVRTLLREAFEHGGVFLLDEVDAANPAVLVVINALLANGHCAFPDGVVEKHPDFTLIAGANTIGQGADRQYVGRQQIDAATLDRFVNLVWDYDPAIEAAAAGVPLAAVADAPRPAAIAFEVGVTPAETERRAAEYVRYVVAVRNAVASFGKSVRFIVSPRASKHGAALVRAGFSIADACELAIWKGLDSDTRAKLEAAAAR
jgi:cobaltochelatase CobS